MVPVREGFIEMLGQVAVVSAEAGADALEAAALEGVYPNPSRGAFEVRYGLPEAAEARVALYDVLGREVAVLASGTHEAGWHTARLEAAIAAGVYVVRFQSAGAVRTSTVTVVR